jgi:hypothetical protein
VDESSDVTVVFYEGLLAIDEDPFGDDGPFFPIASMSIPLPAGTEIVFDVHNLAAGDQISNVGLLVDEVDDTTPMPSGGTLSVETFANPAVGAQFSTTVPSGEVWRVWGGSCHAVGDATNINRTPTFIARHGDTHIFVSSNGMNYNTGSDQVVVYHDQRALYHAGIPIVTVAGEVWDMDPNPAGRVYNPVGCRSLWLPEGTEIVYHLQAIQTGDIVTQVGMLVEKVTGTPTINDPAYDGVGEIMTFADPAAGADLEVTVTAGKRWRVWGGSCNLDTSAVAGNRIAQIRYETAGGDVLWAYANARSTSANNTHRICYNNGEHVNEDLFINRYVPTCLPAIWLPAGSKIIGTFTSMDAGDQISDIGFLVEEEDE